MQGGYIMKPVSQVWQETLLMRICSCLRPPGVTWEP